MYYSDDDNGNIVSGSIVSDSLYGNGGDDALYGLEGNDSLDGGIGNDLLDGGLGADVMVGGTGNDIYYVENVSDQTLETITVLGEIDNVYAAISWQLGYGIENLFLDGTSSINGIGNGLDNFLVGNSGSNILKGGSGNDIVDGGNGADTIDGGTGNDTLIGGIGEDLYIVDSIKDVIQETSSASNEYDEVYSSVSWTLGANLESLTLEGYWDDLTDLWISNTNVINGTGNALNNYLTGNAAANVLDGGAGNDSLEGGAGNDTLLGGTGNDHLYGGEGNDYLDGGTEKDDLEGGAGNDSLLGDAGNDDLDGGAGNDTLLGGAGNDYLQGGAGNDTLSGGTGNDIYWVDSTTDVITETSVLATEIDTVYSSVSRTLGANLENLYLSGTVAINGTGNMLNNTLDGNSATNVLDGGAGDDDIDGGAGNDTLIGGAGNDSLFSGSHINETGDDILIGGTGIDTYYVDSAKDVIQETSTAIGERDHVYAKVSWVLGANLEDLSLHGKWVYDEGLGLKWVDALNGTGNALSNWLHGNSANNILIGGAGNDSLDGDTGNDTLIGGTGNDSYSVDSVKDVIQETSTVSGEIDRVHSTVSWTLGANLEHLYLSGTMAINGSGNALNNYLNGNDADNVLDSGAGNDYLWANNGNDILLGGAGNDSLYGHNGNDTLMGDTGNDSLDGGTGNDTLIGGTGNDQYSVDSVKDVVQETSTVFGEVDTVYSTVSWILGANLESLSLGGYWDEAAQQWVEGAINGGGNALNNDLSGNRADNVLDGGAGNDSLYGGNGDDTLIGGSGNDTLSGGDGNDSYYVDSAGDIVAEWDWGATGYDSVYSTVSWVLGEYFENLTLEGYWEPTTEQWIEKAINGTGNTLDNLLVGNSAANTLKGESGNDHLYGEGGDDKLDGSAGDDHLSGGTGKDSLSGGVGNDVLDGGAGNDTLIGGVGNDGYHVDSAGDVILETNAATGEHDEVVATVSWTLGANLESLTLGDFWDDATEHWVENAINGTGNALNNTLIGNSATNTLKGEAGNDDLYGEAGNDAIDGGTGNDALYGGVGNDSLFGSAGNDIVDGGLGDDTLIGGAGSDWYYVDSSGDVIQEISTIPGEFDSVQSTVSWSLGANLEELRLTGQWIRSGGGTGWNWVENLINGTGNELNNALFGNAAANILVGKEGNDILDGGGGIDTLTGGTGNDVYYVDNIADVTIETSNLATEMDTVFSSVNRALGMNLEKLVLTGSKTISGSGNALANTLSGNGAANTLDGGAGNDAISGESGNDSLVGGLGIDTMTGGSGNDTYNVDNAGDVTTETSTLATEIDTVISTVSRTLGANIERLTLSGTAAINGAGNTLNNTLVGNGAANTLGGGAGNDVLNGAAGADKMLGGAGNDTYYVDLATDRVYETTTLTSTVNAGGVDRVISTVSYTLGSFVENLTLAGTTAINGTGNTLNNALIGNAAANILNGGVGNDVLNGAAGNDFLSGAAGEDFLISGLGNDTLAGGVGKDIFLFDTTLNATTNKDSLTDFSVVDDTIRLDRTIFARLTTLGTLNSVWFKASATGKATDSNDYLLYNTTTGALLYDQDATGAGAATQFATLTTKPKLTAADFVVVA